MTDHTQRLFKKQFHFDINHGRNYHADYHADNTMHKPVVKLLLIIRSDVYTSIGRSNWADWRIPDYGY